MQSPHQSSCRRLVPASALLRILDQNRLCSANSGHGCSRPARSSRSAQRAFLSIGGAHTREEHLRPPWVWRSKFALAATRRMSPCRSSTHISRWNSPLSLMRQPTPRRSRHSPRGAALGPFYKDLEKALQPDETLEQTHKSKATLAETRYFALREATEQDREMVTVQARRRRQGRRRRARGRGRRGERQRERGGGAPFAIHTTHFVRKRLAVAHWSAASLFGVPAARRTGRRGQGSAAEPRDSNEVAGSVEAGARRRTSRSCLIRMSTPGCLFSPDSSAGTAEAGGVLTDVRQELVRKASNVTTNIHVRCRATRRCLHGLSLDVLQNQRGRSGWLRHWMRRQRHKTPSEMGDDRETMRSAWRGSKKSGAATL